MSRVGNQAGRFYITVPDKEPDQPIWKTYSFWIETIIFIISVCGALLISYGITKGF